MRRDLASFALLLLAIIGMLAAIRLFVGPNSPNPEGSGARGLSDLASLEDDRSSDLALHHPQSADAGRIISAEARTAADSQRGMEIVVVKDPRFPTSEPAGAIEGRIDLQLIDEVGQVVGSREVEIREGKGYVESWPESVCAYRMYYCDLTCNAGSDAGRLFPEKTTALLEPQPSRVNIFVLRSGIYAVSAATGQALDSIWLNSAKSGYPYWGPTLLPPGREHQRHAVPANISADSLPDRLFVGAPGHGWVEISGSILSVDQPVIVQLGPAGTVLLASSYLRGLAARSEVKEIQVRLSPAKKGVGIQTSDGRSAVGTTLYPGALVEEPVLRWDGIAAGDYLAAVKVPATEQEWHCFLTVQAGSETIIDDALLGILDDPIRSIQLSFSAAELATEFQGIEVRCGGASGSQTISSFRSSQGAPDSRKAAFTYARSRWRLLSELDLVLPADEGLLLESHQVLRLLPWGVAVATDSGVRLPDGLLTFDLAELKMRNINVLVDGLPGSLRSAQIRYSASKRDSTLADHSCFSSFSDCPEVSGSTFRFLNWPDATPIVKLVLGSQWDHQSLTLTEKDISSGFLSLESAESDADYIHLAFASSGFGANPRDQRAILSRVRFLDVEGKDVFWQFNAETAAQADPLDRRHSGTGAALNSRPKIYEHVWRIGVPQVAQFLHVPGWSPSDGIREIPVRTMINQKRHASAEDPLVLWP